MMDMEHNITIMDLPPPVIVNILSFLNHEDILMMRNICPVWNHLSYDSSLWKTLSTNDCKKSFLFDGSFCKLLHEVEAYIEVLHFDIQYISILEYLTQSNKANCQNLQELRITNDRLLGKTIDINKMFSLDQKMVKLSQKCKKLKTLHYDNFFVNTDAVFDKLKKFSCSTFKETIDETLDEPTRLKTFLKRHPQIEDLDLDIPVLPCNGKLSVTSILSDLPNLRKLRLFEILSEEISPQLQPWNHQLNLESLTLYCLSCVTDETIVAILRQVPKLKTFDVRYCEQVTNVTLKSVAKNCRDITHFSIVGHRPVLFTDAGVKEVAYNCSKLERVTVIPCSDDDDQDIYAFISHCPELKLLVASGGVTDRTILKMTETCPNIFYLDFHECPKLTGASISAVLKRYKDLESLTLTGDKNVKALVNFDEAVGLKEMKNNEKKIAEEICVSEKGKLIAVKHFDKQEHEQQGKTSEEEKSEVSENQSKLELETLAESIGLSMRLSFLACLYMNGCFDITDDSLFNLACYCTNLRKLHLSGCVNLTDRTVKAFFQRCPFIIEFDICLEDTPFDLVVEKVTDIGLADIARYGKKLRMIKLDFRDNITTAGLFEVIHKCPLICHVQIAVIKGKTEMSKEKLMQYAKACKEKFICMKVDGEGTEAMACLDIHIFSEKPSYSSKYFFCNFK